MVATYKSSIHNKLRKVNSTKEVEMKVVRNTAPAMLLKNEAEILVKDNRNFLFLMTLQ